HYYEGRLRPPAAYALGLVPWWGRAGSAARAMANAVTQSRSAASALKRIAGVAPERGLPRFAARTFRDWFRARPVDTDGRPVLLWPDPFTNLFQPEVGIAAVEVLEAAGFRVRLPGRWLCCGRPLYDFGMLNLARRQLRGILDALSMELEAGVPVVGLEPS